MNFGFLGGLTDACYGELLKVGITLSPNTVKIVSVLLYFFGLYLLSLSIKDKKIKLAVILTFVLSVQSLLIIYATYSLIVPIISFILLAVYLGFEYTSKGKPKNPNHILTMDLNKYHIFLVLTFILIVAYGWFAGKLSLSMFNNWQSLIIYSLPLLLSLVAFTEPKHHERLPITEKIITFLIALFGLFIDPVLSIIPLIQLIKESYHVIFYSKSVSRATNQLLFLILVLMFWATYGFTYNLSTALAGGIFLVIISYIFIFASSLDLKEISKYLVYGVALVMLVVFAHSVYPNLSITIPTTSEINAFTLYPNAYILSHPNAYKYFTHDSPLTIDANHMLDSKSDFGVYINNVTNVTSHSHRNTNIRKYMIFPDSQLYNQLKATKNVFKLLAHRTVSSNGNTYTEALYGNDMYQFLMYLDTSNNPLTYDISINSKAGYSQTIPFTKIVPLNKDKGYLGYVVNINGIEDSVLYDWLLHKTPVNNTGGVFVYDYN